MKVKMTLFEGKSKWDPARSTDEADRWYVTIVGTQTVDNHTEYVMEIKNNRSGIWSVSRRYNDFRNLHLTIESLLHGNDVPEFPKKKMTGSMDPNFVAQRLEGLQAYIQCLVTSDLLRTTSALRKFLCPQSYSQDFPSINTQNVSLWFRGSSNYEVGNIYPSMGWRLKKDFFKVKGGPELGSENILSWTDLGSNSQHSLFDKKIYHSIAKSLMQLEHPNICPTALMEFNESGAVVVRKYHVRGSLRDLMYSVKKPSGNYWTKYALRKGQRKFETADLRLIGYQILVGLSFLHSKSIAHGHLHSGNVFISDDGVAQISEQENYIIGLNSALRDFAVQNKASSSSLESYDIYCFGHLLYEMSTGQTLSGPDLTLDAFPDEMPDAIKSILFSILSTEVLKTKLPTLEELRNEPFFSEVNLTRDRLSKPYLKFSIATKEALVQFREAMEKSLTNEHKKVLSEKVAAKREDLLKSKSSRKQRLTYQKTDHEDTKRIEGSNGVGPGFSNFEPGGQLGLLSGADSKVSNGDSANLNPKLTDQNRQSPPQPAPPAPPPPPPNAPTVEASSIAEKGSGNRAALLGSIVNFNKGGLKKAATVDKSGPKI